MERAASTLGDRWAVPQIVTGGLALAVITSLPNAVAAVYLASRGRGAAVLSTALNSNALNIVAGLLLPAAVLGLGAPTGSSILVASWALGLTVLALGFAWRDRGLTRTSGSLIIGAYLVFTICLVAGADRTDVRIAVVPPVLVAMAAAWWSRRSRPGAVSVSAGIPRQARRVSVRSDVDGGTARTVPFVLRAGDGGGPSLLPGRTVNQLFGAALGWCAVVAAVDALSGRHLVLIGLLIVGPCCTLLTGRWRRTALAGLFAIALAVACGKPDGIFGTGEHLAFVGSVVAVTVVATASAAMTAQRRPCR